MYTCEQYSGHSNVLNSKKKKKRKLHKTSLLIGWLNKLCYVHLMEHNVAIS